MIILCVFITETIVSAEEEKHVAAVQKAMEERGMLDHTIVHGVFVGPARSGKNSLMERLLGRMPSSVSPSTGVAESVVQVKVIQKSATFAANVEESIWSVMDYDDEAIKLMLINSESQNRIEIPLLQTEEPVDTVISGNNSQSSETPTSNTDQDESQREIIDLESEDEWYEAQSSLANDQPIVQSSSIRPCPQLPNSYVPPLEIVKIALRKKGKAGLEVLQQHFHKTWSLYLTNTGGQMEFQEVLPLLVSGPSMFFFTFRLDRDLNKSYAIEYDLSDGTSAKPYTSTLTTLDGILQTLASISAMGISVYQGKQKRTVALRPKVFLVGTHKDKLDSKKASKYIVELDQQLQQVLQATSHEDLVEFASPTQLIFTVNNFSKSDLDFQNIRSAFERVVLRDEFRMTSPSHWLIFSLALRKLKSDVISYDLCLEVARQCGLADDELDEALHFIHSKMGLIRYFPYDDVKDFVVIHPQHLFDKVTELIVNTFTFEKAGKRQMDDFKKKGVFSLVAFENVYSRSNSDIKAFQFLKLLERLRITAPFHLKGNLMFFFPCVLAHVLTSKISVFGKLSQIWMASSVPPALLVTFECGYCPKGIPGALISYLMANEMGSSFIWNLCHDKIFRNQVSFRVGPLDTVMLDIYSTYLMITITIDKSLTRDVKCMPYKVCSAVREAIETGIRQVTSSINYIRAEHSLTFPCKCNSDHPAVLEFVGCTPHNMYCSKTNKTYPLPKSHELWQISLPQDHQQQLADLASIPELNNLRIQEGEQEPSCGQAKRLTNNHHAVLLKQLTKHSADWKMIGSYLGFSSGELNDIEARPFLLQGAPRSWLSAMLAQWLQWAPGDSRGSTDFATLEDLKTALNHANLGATAHDLGV